MFSTANCIVVLPVSGFHAFSFQFLKLIFIDIVKGTSDVISRLTCPIHNGTLGRCLIKDEQDGSFFK